MDALPHFVILIRHSAEKDPTVAIHASSAEAAANCSCEVPRRPSATRDDMRESRLLDKKLAGATACMSIAGEIDFGRSATCDQTLHFFNHVEACFGNLLLQE